MNKKIIALPVEKRWLFVTIGGQRYALPIGKVQKLVHVDSITKLPSQSDCVRGIASVDSSVGLVEIYDTKQLFGMKSFLKEKEELLQLLKDREMDHIAWLKELEKAVTEKRLPELQTDPNQCAFGKWYNKFEPDYYRLRNVMSAFDYPHQQIHKLAVSVKTAMLKGDYVLAERIVAEGREQYLNRLIDLFKQARDTIENKPENVVLINNDNGDVFGLIVDSFTEFAEVEGRRHLPLGDSQKILRPGLTSSVIQMNNGLVQVIDFIALLNSRKQ